jgi:Kef-type K+ transport system membrane component KefB
MRRVGASALLAAALGVAGSFVLGWAVAAWLLPAAGSFTHAFVGAAITATSVGITARVLKELGHLRGDEARVILGTAIVDDVIGLMVLAVMTGFATALNGGGQFSYAWIAIVLVKAAIFLVGALILGMYLPARLLPLASKLEASGVLLAFGLGLCFLLCWLAALVGLAPIVGAFAAGVALEDAHYSEFVKRGERSLEELIEPIASFFVPIFFVIIGARADLTVFGHPRALLLATGLTAAAIIGKQLCMLGVLQKGIDRLSVGIAMIPRGEVQLIFASAGLSLVVGGRPVMDETMYSAIVVVVILTTIVTPPALKWSFGRARAPKQDVSAAAPR